MNLKIYLVALMLVLLGCYSGNCEVIEPDDTTKTIKLGFVLPKGATKISIPFELNNNLMVIKVLLNNAIPLKFILDTGVRTTVLTEKTFTDLLNLTYSRKITIPGIGGEKIVDAYVTNNVTLKIGEIIGRGHALLVLDEDLLQLKNYLGTSVHGILGYELFSRFIVEINYSTRLITFYDPAHFKKKRRFTTLPINIVDTKPYLLINYSLNDSITRTGQFMVDTGASHSFLLDNNEDSTFYIPNPSIYSHLGRGLAGEMYGYISRINQVTLPPFLFEDVIATFPDSANYLIDPKTTNRDGTIGGGLLSRFVVIFDYVNEKLYLKKGRTFKKPFEYNLSGLIVRAKGLRLDEYEIVEVRKGCAAQHAGVLAGDEITVINGQYTKDLKLDEVLGMINSRANKAIRMVVLRNGVKTKLFFKLERQV